MATFGTFSFPTTFSGDTLDEQTFTVTRTGTALDDLATVEVEFRLNKTGSCNVELSLSNGNGITILDASAWQFRIDAITPLTLDPGYYVCSFRFIDTQGRKKNYLRGNITVLQPETRD